jgi:hypothetical protein
MTDITLCPACLTELPDNYPYDHVVFDRALNGQPQLFDQMRTRERRELILISLSRSMPITELAHRLGRDVSKLRALLPAEHPESLTNFRHRRATERTQLDNTVRALWDRGLSDTDIALRTGYSAYVIGDIRRRLGLSTLVHRRGHFSRSAR